MLVLCWSSPYKTFKTCSLICSKSSFIKTTIFCISLWLDLEPKVLISRPISWVMKPNFFPGARKEQLEQFDRLLTIMKELRELCPWDREQTFESLRTLTIEETYELADAILKADKP